MLKVLAVGGGLLEVVLLNPDIVGLDTLQSFLRCPIPLHWKQVILFWDKRENNASTANTCSR